MSIDRYQGRGCLSTLCAAQLLHVCQASPVQVRQRQLSPACSAMNGCASAPKAKGSVGRVIRVAWRAWSSESNVQPYRPIGVGSRGRWCSPFLGLLGAMAMALSKLLAKKYAAHHCVCHR